MTVRTLRSEGGVKQDSPIPEDMMVKGQTMVRISSFRTLSVKPKLVM